MALYAIGDVQGCLDSLKRLLFHIGYKASRDRLWFVGDLVNRGTDSLGTLRYVRELNAECVLGNHDLHLLAVAAGGRPLKSSDTFTDVLDAPERDELLDWLVRRPLLFRDDALGWAMVHAGLPPAWDVEKGSSLAREVEQTLTENYRDGAFMARMYGDRPVCWSRTLTDMDRLRFVINAMTRMRFCDSQSQLALDYNGPPGSQPPPFRPWFELWPYDSHRMVFGHWSTLGARDYGNAVSTDSGCVWGQRLTAVRLAPGPVEFFAIPCPRRQQESQSSVTY